MMSKECAAMASPKPAYRLRVAAVLLAAGEGRRMGGVAKALIRLQGVSLVQRQLTALHAAGVDEVVVVTGYARDAVAAQVQGFKVTLAHNAQYEQGQQQSVRTGLDALQGDWDAVFVLLVDQPLICASDLTDLITAFQNKPSGQVLVPMVNGQRGNPVLLDALVLAQVRASPPHLGVRALLDQQPDLVCAHETGNCHYITDLDTLEEVALLTQRTGWSVELPAGSSTN